MTKDHNLKRQVRARAEASGESYTVARERVLTESGAPAAKRAESTTSPRSVELDLPISALLSQVLIAFTIEFDNEFERRMRASGYPAFLSLVWYLNLFRFLPVAGTSIRQLAEDSGLELSHVIASMGGPERWGFLVLDPDPASDEQVVLKWKNGWNAMLRDGFGSRRGLKPDWRVTPTPRMLQALEVWPGLLSEVEQRWVDRFGKATIANLRSSLQSIVEQFDVHLPLGLHWDLHAFERAPVSAVRASPESIAALPLPGLLSRPLTMFALDFDLRSGIPIYMAANEVRVLNDHGTRIADLPKVTGLSPFRTQVNQLKKRYGVMEVVPDPDSKRGKLVRLTSRGLQAQAAYHETVDQVESEWRRRYGSANIDKALESLEDVLNRRDATGYRIAAGIRPGSGLPRSGDATQELSIGWPAALRERVRQLVAQTERFVADPHGTIPHFPVWDGDRGMGP